MPDGYCKCELAPFAQLGKINKYIFEETMWNIKYILHF